MLVITEESFLTLFVDSQNVYSQICCITLLYAFCKLQRNFGFSALSIILADLLGNTCLLVIGAFRSTLFVSVFQGYLHVIALFRTIID